MKITRIAVVAALCLVPFQTLAQNTISYYSALIKSGPAPAECVAAGATVRNFINQFPHKDKWTWVVVCDEASWKLFEQHIGYNVPGTQLMAETDLRGGSTWVRGYTINHPISNKEEDQPRHIIAHELGHIFLDTSNEAKVEQITKTWLLKNVAENK